MIRNSSKKDSYIESLDKINETLNRLALMKKKKFSKEVLSPIKFENCAEAAYSNLIKLLCNYEDIDRISSIRKLTKNKRTALINDGKVFESSLNKRISSSSEQNNLLNPILTCKASLQNINKDIKYFLLNMTNEEFHKLFLKFYSNFDRNKTSNLLKEDLILITKFVSNKEVMGKEKFDMSAKFILKEDFFSDAINKLETIFSNNASDDSMLERLFDQLKNPTPIALKNGRDCVYVIDFLKILPLIMSYFLDYVRKKVELRRENLDFLKGSRDNEKKYFSTDDPNDLSKKIINAKTTLIKRFKADGFDYEKFKFEKILSYRDIEKTLISFQTFFSETLSSELVELILTEIQKKMEVDPITKIEKKRKKFINILHWLAMKICLHNCCQDLNKRLISDPINYIEESCLWNCAAFSYKLDKNLIPQKFLKFVNSHSEEKEFNNKEIKKLLEMFLRKLIPHLTSGEFIELLSEFKFQSILDNSNSKLKDLSNIIYKMLIFKIEKTVKNYILKCFSQEGKKGHKTYFGKEILLFENRNSIPHYESIRENYSDEDESSTLKNKSKLDVDFLKKYFFLEKFFEKYRYCDKKNASKSESDIALLESKPLRKLNAKELAAILAEQKLMDLMDDRRNLILKEKNKEILLSLNGKNKLSAKLKSDELDEKKKKKFLKNSENYMNSGFSFKEIQDFEPTEIKSMISIDQDLNDHEKIRLSLMQTKIMQKRMKHNLKKNKVCFNLCSERELSQIKCNIF